MQVINAQALSALIDLALQVGESILLQAKKINTLSVKKKHDQTLVSEADILADLLLTQGLTKILPDIAIVSEENTASHAYQLRNELTHILLLDPLDGSRGFLNGGADYTINIALIEHNEPVFSMIYAPASRELYYAFKGKGAYKWGSDLPLQSNAPRKTYQLLAGQKVDATALIEVLPKSDSIQFTQLSSALKFCYLAEGKFDFCPRVRPTYEWDTAAGQLILEEAGGIMVDFLGKSLQYNARKTLLNPPFLALADINRLDEVIPYLQQMEKKYVT